MKRLVLVLLLLRPVAGLADFHAGGQAYLRGDYATAMREWRPMAEQGNADAQFSLGAMYDYGKGVPEDDAEAAKWYRLAAEQGNADAQFSLGAMYDNGEGVPEVDAEAAKWYRLSAAQGNAGAQLNLGNHHYTKGVPEDYVQAYAWWNLAAAQGQKTAPGNRDIVRKIMRPEQIAEAQKLSKKLCEKIPNCVR